MQNSTFKLTKYFPEIVDGINLREEQQDWYDNEEQLKGHARILYRSSMFARTLTFEGKIVACLGAYKCWGKVFEAWMLVDKNAPEIFKAHPVKMTKEIKRIMDMFPKTADRLQTHVKADFKMGRKFVEMLGFENEGLSRKWGPRGDDYIQYAKVKQEDK